MDQICPQERRIQSLQNHGVKRAEKLVFFAAVRHYILKGPSECEDTYGQSLAYNGQIYYIDTAGSVHMLDTDSWILVATIGETGPMSFSGQVLDSEILNCGVEIED